MKNLNFLMILAGFILILIVGFRKESSEEIKDNTMDYEKLLEEEYKNVELSVTVTTYNPVKEQCDDDPLITADNSKIDLQKLKAGKIKWIAVSRDLLEFYEYGDKIRIKSNDPSINGIYEIHDTMNRRYSNRIDILTHKLYGKWENVKIEGV